MKPDWTFVLDCSRMSRLPFCLWYSSCNKEPSKGCCPHLCGDVCVGAWARPEWWVLTEWSIALSLYLWLFGLEAAAPVPHCLPLCEVHGLTFVLLWPSRTGYTCRLLLLGVVCCRPLTVHLQVTNSLTLTSAKKQTFIPKHPPIFK